MLAGLYGTANITFAGGKNSTFINGIGTDENTPSVVNYFNSGAPCFSLHQHLVVSCIPQMYKADTASVRVRLEPALLSVIYCCTALEPVYAQ